MSFVIKIKQFEEFQGEWEMVYWEHLYETEAEMKLALECFMKELLNGEIQKISVRKAKPEDLE